MELFSPFGDIQSAKVKEDSSEQAFVQFRSHESALKAIDTFNGKKEVNGKVIFVSKHISKQENMHNSKVSPITQNLKEQYEANVFVKFVPKDATEDRLKEVFSKAGHILSVKLKDFIQYNQKGESYSNYKVGYVCFENVKQAQNCIRLFDESNALGLGQKPIKVDFWQSKQDQKRQNEEK